MDKGGSDGRGRGRAPPAKAGGGMGRGGAPPAMAVGGMGRGGAPLGPVNLGRGRPPSVPMGSGRAIPITNVVNSSSARKGLVTLGRDSEGLLTLRRGSMGQVTFGRGRGEPTGTDCGEKWQIQKVIEICNHRLTGDYVAGAIVTSIKLSKTTASQGEIVNGTMVCRRDTCGPQELPCSFMVLKQEGHARAIFECAMSATHQRNLKAYFYAFLDILDAHVVCFERLEPFVPNDNNRDVLRGDHETCGRLERHWVSNIREILQCLDVINKVGYRHTTLYSHLSFCYASQGKGEKRLKIKDASMVMTGGRNEICEQVKHQHQQFLLFLEKQGAESILEYKSFKYLLERSTNMETILKHPFVLESPKDRVLSVVSTNEVLFTIPEVKLNKVDFLLGEEFKNFDWKRKVQENAAKFGTFSDTSNYGSTYSELTRFLRNFVEHQRDVNPEDHIPYDTLDKTISNLFPCFICWAYTFTHIIRKE